MHKNYNTYQAEKRREILKELENLSDDLFIDYKALNSSYYYNEDREETFKKRRLFLLSQLFKTPQDVKKLPIIQHFYQQLNSEFQAIFNTYLQLMPTRTMHNHSSMLRSYKTKHCYQAIDVIFSFIVNCFLLQSFDFKLDAYLKGKDYFEENTRHDFVDREFYASVFSLAQDETFETIETILSDIIYQNENLLSLSYDLIGGMLLSTKPKLQDMVMDLLKSAERSEGLRQSVVEQIDLASLDVYKRFLEHIDKENLKRFSSVKRAYLVFTGLEYDLSERKLAQVIDGIHNCLILGKTKEYLESDSPLELYLGLYALACQELHDALDYIAEHYEAFADHKKATCLLFMKKTNLPIEPKYLFTAFKKSENLQLLFFIVSELIYQFNPQKKEDKKEYLLLFSHLLDKTKKIPKRYSILDEEQTQSIRLNQATKKMLLFAHELDDFYEPAYKHFEKIGYTYSLDKPIYESIAHPYMRKKLIELLASNLESMRGFAFERIKKLQLTLTQEEFETMAQFLKSKRSDTRKNICTLFKQADASTLLTCSKQLLQDKNKEKQKAAIDILLDNQDKLRQHEGFIEIKEQIKNMQFPEEYQANLCTLLEKKDKEKKTLFFNKAYRPKLQDIHFNDAIMKQYLEPNEEAFIAFCQDIIRLHEGLIGEEFESTSYDGSTYIRKFGFEYNRSITTCVYDQSSTLPTYKTYCFYEKFLHLETTFSSLDFLLHSIYMEHLKPYFEYIDGQYQYQIDRFKELSFFLDKGYFPKLSKVKAYFKTLDKEKLMKYIHSIESVIYLLIDYKNVEKKNSQEDKEVKNFFMDLFACMIIKDRDLHQEDKTFIDSYHRIQHLVYQKDKHKNYHFEDKEKAMHIIFAADKVKASEVYTIDEDLLLYFVKEDLLSIDYLYQLAFDTKKRDERYYRESNSKSLIQAFSNRIKRQQETKLVYEIYQRSINTMLETELKRTESDTEFSASLHQAKVFFGVETFLTAVFKMGKMPFVRGYSWGTKGKKDMFSHIIYHTIPLKTDTQKAFNSLVKTYKISDKKLLEATMYNLEFIDFTESYLKTKGFKKAAYYFKAHMNDTLSEQQKTITRRYTDISFEDLQHGQIDLHWFKDSYKTLKKKKFMELYDCAKYITDGSKHKRAQHFADAIMGNLKEKEVLEKIKTKRNQDMVLAFGLLPLGKNKLKKALSRYKYLQSFLKESQAFGAQKRASEALKVSISMKNLARNYGFHDVNRFVWKMETELIADMMPAFMPKAIDDLSVHLSIENPQKPELLIFRNKKPLKSIPSKYKKHAYILQLKAIKKDLKAQYSRARKSLEDAMVQEENFLLSELLDLYKHPIIGALLKDLLFQCKDKTGFLKGNELMTLEGKHHLLDDDVLTMIHPIRLQEQNTWILWQNHLMQEKIKQPFKQVFREIYLMTKDEQENKGYTNRFAGYQIEGKKMLGILKSRGWMLHQSDGFEKMNHQSQLRINLYCYADWYTPAELESPSIEQINFVNNETGQAMDMLELSPVLFSETMRDIDLVVSVAYVGGVDVMLNHSTIDMRTRILEHHLNLFKLKNYHFDKHHLTIQGTYGEYSVHLGSGIVQMKGKGMLPVFPVHASQRGHIFLPFLDEDPKTAEIISKALLFARDHSIKDPSILMHLK